MSPKSQTIAYIRVSKEQQNCDHQKIAIVNYGLQNNITVDTFIIIEKSSQKSTKERRVDELMNMLNKGDLLIVTELSRLGRSIGQIIQMIDAITKKGIHFIAIKEGIKINGKENIQTKVMVTMFSLFAEIERDLISERTKEALAGLKEKGVKLGRPKGTGSSKLDPYKEEIKLLLENGSTKTFIAKRYNTTPSNLHKWLRKQKEKNLIENRGGF